MCDDSSRARAARGTAAGLTKTPVAVGRLLANQWVIASRASFGSVFFRRVGSVLRSKWMEATRGVEPGIAVLQFPCRRLGGERQMSSGATAISSARFSEPPISPGTEESRRFREHFVSTRDGGL